MKKRILKYTLGLLAVSFFITSCYKEGPTIAEVSVVDQYGAPLNNAMIVLYPVPTNSNTSN